MNRLKLMVVSLSLLFGVALLVPATVTYAADDSVTTACKALGSSNCNGTGGGTSLGKVVKTVISILSLVVGIASVIMIIVGGLRYVVSNGDSNAITGAKNTIIYAIIGLVVVALSQFIVQFVLKNVT